MEEDSSKSENGRGGGFFDSLRGIGATLIAIVQTRLELLSTEIEEEKVRLGWLLLMAGIALFFFGLGLLVVTLLIIITFWETHRLFIVGALAVLYLAVGTGLWLVFLNKARAKSPLFNSSIEELSKDRERLRIRS